MRLIQYLNASARPGEPGHRKGKRYRVLLNGRELKRCTLVLAVLGWGVVEQDIEVDGRLVFKGDEVARAIRVGRIRVEQLP